jgi:DNA-binding beta-propeller fold protein YncE
LAIHPFTRDIYVIASVGKLLVVLNPEGKIKHVIKLPVSVFKQPEGIAFDSAGNLFITNEGRNGKGNILKFLYLKDEDAANTPVSAL